CVLAAPRLVCILRAVQAAQAPRIGLAVGTCALIQMLVFAHGPLSLASPIVADRGFQAPFLGSDPGPSDREAADSIVALASEQSGPLLSEEAGFAIVAGQPVIGNATQLRNLSDAGLWDSHALVDMIAAHRFGLVILNAQRYPAPVL